MASQDFYTAALTSLTNQITAHQQTSSFDPHAYAQSLIEDDHPKIDSAVKSYLSLVAARSCTMSEIDVLEVSSSKLMTSENDNGIKIERAKCIFMEEANRSSLACARALLLGMNSTIIPEVVSNQSQKNQSQEEELKQNVIRILWNGLIQSSSGNQQEKKKRKPSKLLGREVLIVTYPYVQERFRRGVAQARKETDVDSTKTNNTHLKLYSLSNEQLPPIPPPANVDLHQWEMYYHEFGQLLSQACDTTKQQDGEDDSQLLWSADGGKRELKERRERRERRAEDAVDEKIERDAVGSSDE